MSSTIQRLNVLALYRAKLRVCREMGHSCGNWNRIYVYKTSRLMKRFKPKTIINEKSPGTIMWNNIRHQYKIHIDEPDPECIDDMIDYGFEWLYHINNVFGKYKRTSYYKGGKAPPKQIEAGDF